MQRSLLKFDEAIKSEHTKKVYKHYLTKFLEWCKIKDYDSLLELKDSFLQEVLEDYLFHQKKRVSPNTIPSMFAGLELFFVMNDKNLNFKKIRKMFPEKVTKSGKDAWTANDIQQMIRGTKSKRLIALIHVLASTGCRIGAIPSLTLQHLEDMSDGCRSIKFYEGSDEQYFGFLHPEASKALQEYLDERKSDGEIFKQDTPLFRQSYDFGSQKAKQLSVETLKVHLFRLSKSANLQRERVGRRFNIQIAHGIRKFYATVLKNNDKANPSLCEKLLGHKGLVSLDQNYHRPIKDVLFDEFKKHVYNLTIDPTERQKAEIQTLKAEKSQISKLEDKINENEFTMDAMDDKIRELDAKLRVKSEESEFARVGANLLATMIGKEKYAEILAKIKKRLKEVDIDKITNLN